VDEAFVVVNGKDPNRLEANALDQSRASSGFGFGGVNASVVLRKM